MVFDSANENITNRKEKINYHMRNEHTHGTF